MRKHLNFFFFNSVNYIASLKTTSGELLVDSRRKAGFRGLICSILSVQNLFQDLVKTKLLNYVLTYKLSQDHLEMFFSAIRSKGGFNNNPTATQFEGAYKRLLIHVGVKASFSANCVQIDNTSILTISSRKKNDQVDDLLPSLENNDRDIYDAFDQLHNIGLLSRFLIDVNEYIAGFVARKIAKSIKCAFCIDLLFSHKSESRLLNRKNQGGLMKASPDVIKICQVAEKTFRIFSNSTPCPLINKMIVNCRRFLQGHDLFSVANDHILNQDPLNNHCSQLITLIAQVYLTVRVHYMNKNINSVDVRIRQQYNKLILFKNQ